MKTAVSPIIFLTGLPQIVQAMLHIDLSIVQARAALTFRFIYGPALRAIDVDVLLGKRAVSSRKAPRHDARAPIFEGPRRSRACAQSADGAIGKILQIDFNPMRLPVIFDESAIISAAGRLFF